MRTSFVFLVAAIPVVLSGGCAVRRFAVDAIGSAVGGGGTTFASENDPELAREAIPFGLKLTESLLEESPRNRALLLSAARSFTQYAYGFVQQDADLAEEKNLAAAQALRDRARKLYVRARDYALRGLALRHAGLARRLRADPAKVLVGASRADVPFLYWAAAAWGSVIALSKDQPEVVADLPVVEALIDRALELDEAFEEGKIHTFLIAYEMSRVGAPGNSAARARKHFERALELAGSQVAAPLVTFAEQVSVSRQDRKEFEDLLKRALAINADAKPECRLENLVLQRRARWLLSRADELFGE